HSSHADAVVMRVALARAGRHRVVAAAAEDHWFTSRGRAILAVVGAGAFPFPRHGDIGLRRAAALLAAGHDVIMFPEGSRDAAAAAAGCAVGLDAGDGPPTPRRRTASGDLAGLAPRPRRRRPAARQRRRTAAGNGLCLRGRPQLAC
ncbi:MAG TPA: 1-acyl-sn-glycerol-3-phosphate acyltransferase, partial [Euzebya sp.]|nr:1-acyl-sn-glycerol-3-phosphate acyltransferase [Euzebya sp.]